MYIDQTVFGDEISRKKASCIYENNALIFQKKYGLIDGVGVSTISDACIFSSYI